MAEGGRILLRGDRVNAGEWARMFLIAQFRDPPGPSLWGEPSSSWHLVVSLDPLGGQLHLRCGHDGPINDALRLRPSRRVVVVTTARPELEVCQSCAAGPDLTR